jgi:argonaute-like protein implicated in RNA metabolism and viral defense
MLSIDTTAVERALNSVVEKINRLPDDLNAELYAWQSEDLRRKKPWVQRKRKRRMRTVVTRHSGKSLRYRERARQGAKIRAKKKGQRLWPQIQKPVLREQLLDRLRQRMSEVVHRF